MRKLVCFMNNRWVKYLMAGSVTVLMVLVIIFIIRSVKENSLAVSCPDTLVVEYGSTDDEADINETIKKNVLRKKDNKTNIEIEGNVDVTKLGKYDIKIVASRKKKHISRKVAVKVVDTQAPVISLSGDTEITLEAEVIMKKQDFLQLIIMMVILQIKWRLLRRLIHIRKGILQLYIQLKILLVMKHLQNVLYM